MSCERQHLSGQRATIKLILDLTDKVCFMKTKTFDVQFYNIQHRWKNSMQQKYITTNQQHRKI